MAMGLGSFASRVVATKVVATDGSGDFTDIQSAINDLPAGGGVVYIKEGTYNISSTITFGKSNISLIGAGRSTELKAVASYGDNQIMNTETYDYINLSGIFFNGNSQNIRGVDVRTGTNASITLCFFEGFQDTAILTTGILTPTINYMLFADNIIIIPDVSGATGIVIDNSKRCIVARNRMSGGTTGISVQESASQNVIEGNVIADTSTEGILISTASDNIVKGNVCINNGTRGIIVTSGTNADRNLIASNLIDTATFGVRINNSNCNNNFVHGNLTISATISDLGTGTLVSDNKEV